MLVIFSDLDGTLLDRDTYSHEPAREALTAVGKSSAALVLSTSKTVAEVDILRAELGCNHPFIAENGAAVAIPDTYFPFLIEGAKPAGKYAIVSFGSSYESNVAGLRHASKESQVPVQGFADMDALQIAGMTGLTVEEAERARQREHDEPFLILDESRAPLLLDAIASTGRRWSRGGRFYHITDNIDKGDAADFLIACYRRVHGKVTAAGLGDAPNDIPLLRACDRKIIVRSPDADAMRCAVPGAAVTAASGPAGWNEAVLDILAGYRTDSRLPSGAPR